jgi:CTP-dependent riboflavin kinase
MMIQFVLRDLPRDASQKITLVPLPFFSPPELYAPAIIEHFGPIDFIVSNNDWVKDHFRQYPEIQFIAMEVIQREIYRGGVIRSLLEQGDPGWKDLLPPSVTTYLEEINAEQIVPQVCSLDSREEELHSFPQEQSAHLLATVVSGTKVASEYVVLPHFYEAMTRMLGAPPYLGTLNLQLSISANEFHEILAHHDPIRINSKYLNDYEYWGVDCYPAVVQAPPTDGRKAFVVLLDFGTLKEWTGVVEVVAHPHLRTFLNVEDGSPLALQLLD